ncbi:MAG: type II secretion system protein [Candidatus Paceibacterota bacterium]|jgi:prepilin-type N-terminal cleavage/methylation domain-containing protein
MKKGFTLIELLVVIAIIGILSSVVLASLNSARGKGSDAAVKMDLNGIRAQSEISNSDVGNYSGVCVDTTILNALNGARSAAGLTAAVNTDPAVAGSADTVTCHATNAGWAIEAPLKTAGFFCIDSSGMSTTTASTVIGASSDITCTN